MTRHQHLTFKLARGAERSAAVRLRAQIYTAELGHHGVDEFDDRAHHLVAVDSQGKICSAVRILTPEQRPFEIERFVRLEDIVGHGRNAAQIGGFWIRPSERQVKGHPPLALGMLKVACVFAERRGITDFVMRTHITSLRRFYERALFKVRKDLAFQHPDWGSVFVMHLDLLELRNKHAQSSDPVARYLFSETADLVIQL